MRAQCVINYCGLCARNKTKMQLVQRNVIYHATQHILVTLPNARLLRTIHRDQTELAL